MATEEDPPDLLDTPSAGPAAIRGGVIRIAGFGAGIVITTLSAALLFRHLGVEDGGRYVTVVALVSIVAGLTDAGLTGVALRELVDRDPSEHDSLLRNMIGMRLFLGVIGLTGAVAFAAIAGYGSAMVFGTVLAGIGAITQTFQSTLSVRLLVDLRLGWVTVLEFVRQLASVIGIALLVALGASLVWFFGVLIPASLVAVLATVWLVRGKMPMRPRFAFGEWRELMRDIVPFAAIVLITLVYFRVALIVLSLVSDPDQVGYFGASFRVTEVLISVPQLAVAGAFPIFVRAARDDRDRLSYGIGRMFHAMTVAGAALALGLVLGASFIIEVVAGAEFAPAADVMRIQGVTLFVVFLSVTVNYALLSLRAHRPILLIWGGALLLNGIGSGILGTTHGAEGVAVATMTADILALVASCWVLARRGLPVGQWLRMMPRTLVALAPALAVWFVPIPSLAKALLGVGVYLLVLVLVRGVPEEVYIEARRLRGSAT
ncbi:oligosaccharide flippase family protein [Solirubrobacter soli]|uniref:oligosaccharide flippase family protein n=1 Tax=Solirubrobacter soli TaxID=363832 RepID=UPI000569BA31|nr:oligosaccharide flippase family protein [Solirubrobacter soli]